MYLAGDAYSASSVLVKENGTSNVYHICRDYLGSITHLTDYNGVVLQENSYDAWGRLRNPQTQVLYNDDSQPKLLLDRGYTSHEHLPHFGLINMNARLYSPVLGRFLSPDPYVTMPDFSQNFNRYSYALNNPLKFTDPSGESVVIGAIVFGAVMGGMTSLRMNINNINSYGDMFACFGMGALAGGLTAGAGAAVGGVAGGFVGGMISGGVAGFVGGSSSAWIGGASFGDGLLSGLKGGGISALTAGLMSGISSAMNGGNFWTGAGQAIILEAVLASDESDIYFTTSAKQYRDSGDVIINDDMLRTNIEDRWGISEGDHNIIKITTMPHKGRFSITQSGQYYDNKTGEILGGYVATDPSSIYTSVHISPHYVNGASLADFDAIVGHELLHAYHRHNVPAAVYSSVMSERVAYRYSYDIYMRAGMIGKAEAMKSTALKHFYWGPAPSIYQIPSPIKIY